MDEAASAALAVRRAGRSIGRLNDVLTEPQRARRSGRASLHWPWLVRTWLQAMLILARFCCRQLRIPNTSSPFDARTAWQNFITSGWQAARSCSVPCPSGLAGGGGCGGSCANAAVPMRSVKTIVKTGVRYMIPLSGIRPLRSRALCHSLRLAVSFRKAIWSSKWGVATRDDTNRRAIIVSGSCFRGIVSGSCFRALLPGLAPHGLAAISLGVRAVSSAGRASALHAGCRRFESVTAHHASHPVSRKSPPERGFYCPTSERHWFSGANAPAPTARVGS
jgi:hypothetical protein